MAKTPHSQRRGHGFDPWSGNYIPHAATKTWHSQNKENYYYFIKRAFENCCSEPFFARRSGLWSLQPGILPLVKNLGAFGNSLVVQWVRLRAFTAEGAGSVLGWGTKIP